MSDRSSVARWSYPGFPAYLEQVALNLGVSREIVDRARRLPELSRLSSLVAGTVDAEPKARPAILAHAIESHTALALAYSAATAILLDAFEAHTLPIPDVVADLRFDDDLQPEIANGMMALTSNDDSTMAPVRRGPGRPRKPRD